MSILRREHILYKIRTRATALLALLAIVGCTSDSDIATPESTPTDGKVAVELALCVSPSQQATTRQSPDVVQNGQDLSSYRGIQDLLLIPFATQGEIQGTDEPLSGTIGAFERQGKDASNQYTTTNYLTSNVDLLIGTASFLAYAKANPLSGDTEADTPDYKFKYGKLVPSKAFTEKTFTTPAAISFQLENIYQKTAADEKATALATYMTDIAKASGWRTSTHSTLQGLYKEFRGGEDFKTLAGSCANVQAMLTKLYRDLVADNWVSDDKAVVVNAIKTEIEKKATIDESAKTVTLNSSFENYPDNINLPDGSAAMKWNSVQKPKAGGEEGEMEEDIENSRFVALTSSANGLDMNDQSRYAYPADLYYFANSQIRTSETSQASHYSEVGGTNGTAGTEDNWNHVLSSYSTTNTVVASTTRSVALTDMLNYGVSCLELKILSDDISDVNGNYLVDQASSKVYLKNSTTDVFPLTGVFVGGQFPVKFNFEPDDGTTEEDTQNERIIYDQLVSPGIVLTTTESTPNYTLILQSKINKPVNIVLEFENNSGQPFKGYEGGVIYPGTHFYLSGKVIPKLSGDDKEQRVFKRDHITKLMVKVKSLANAYNVIPDLKTAQHELEVTSIVVQQWSDKTAANKNLFNW